ncbi:MAG: Gfo/Idh/MocA family protein [Chloroflexota bacterium]
MIDRTTMSPPSRYAGPARLGAIGLGGWGRTLARAYSGSSHVELRCCYSRDPGRRQRFADDFACEPAPSLDALLSRPDIDGVIITVPNAQHAAIIEEAAAHGKHIFVEKPVATAAADIGRVRRALRGTGLVFACGHAARRLAGIREMKRRLATGVLGAPSSFEAVFGNERGLEIPAGNWRTDPAQCPGGPLTQIGIHHIDNLQFLLGPVRRVAAMGRSPRADIANQLVVGVLLEFDEVIGYLGADWLTPGTFTIDLHGTQARLRYDLDYTWWDRSAQSDAHSTLTQFVAPPSSSLPGDRHMAGELIPLPNGDYLREEIDEFALALLGQGAVEVGLDAAASNVAVLLAAARALETSKPVDVADIAAEIDDRH